MKAIVAWTTLPDVKSAQKIARGLVQDRLAACVSVCPGVLSTYRWKKRIETAREALLIVKTSAGKQKAARDFVLRRHPYELPEWIVWVAPSGSKKYLDWIGKSIR